uniref:Uncharacterized protein n=1 Tax=Utricularia reniformis TaxID=192314 RepID=A0A1Y0AZR1_9LAMI|nr:hypothetical protein AEK19_MT0403 [Utricularia reniformis]ART30672.1 hypothetical protein AEK19_MT0403 [Utricularia reniformis]
MIQLVIWGLALCTPETTTTSYPELSIEKVNSFNAL